MAGSGYGWRAAFVITGAAGFVWLAVGCSSIAAPGGRPRAREPIDGEILRDRSVCGLAMRE